MENKNNNDKYVCEDCLGRLNDLSNYMDLSLEEMDLLNRPQKILSFSIPLRMDDGSVRMFQAHRVQYNNALGPTKGGIRYHHEVDLNEVKILAFLMALKCSLTGIPYGGAKGGIEVDVSQLSDGEKERLTRGFVRMAHQFIGPNIDIPAPDVNTNAQVMAWFVDEYSKLKGETQFGVVTGKPLELGGSLGREKATSLGGVFVLDKYLSDNNINICDVKVAVQGFGNVGRNIAEILSDRGYKIVAVSDASGALYNDDGLPVKDLCEEKTGGCRLADDAIGRFQKIPNEELLELPVDILIPAALANQIDENNANNVKASVILEMANAPVTKSADEILQKNNITVIPDILANSGGVIVSYFEWVQNSSNEYWSLDRVNSSLEEKIVSSYERVKNRAEKDNTTLRVASYKEAVSRILQAEKLRGNI